MSMSSQKRPGIRYPKGILKTPSSFSSHTDTSAADGLPFVPPLAPAASATGLGAPQLATPEQQAHNRQLAIQHATALQQRKGAEAMVLANLEELIDFPTATSPPYTAASPSPADVARFQALVPPFNTADYDELLTERNCADRCAYIFCPTILGRDRSARANINRLHYNGTKVVTVKQAKLDQWCSKACARRALYIKVQLSESPAWERASEAVGHVELLREGDDLVLEERMRGLSMHGDVASKDTHGHRTEGDVGLLQTALEELALERGDSTTDSTRKLAVMKDILVENPTGRGAVAPTLSSASEAVEGFTPRAQRPGGVMNKDRMGSDDDDDDEEDTDWVL